MKNIPTLTSMKGNFLGLRYDLWLHLMAGYILMLTGLLFVDYIIAGSITLYVAWLKEWYDEYYTSSGFDYLDLYLTVIGGFLGLGVFGIASSFGVL